jgi:hypothetical protein
VIIEDFALTAIGCFHFGRSKGKDAPPPPLKAYFMLSEQEYLDYTGRNAILKATAQAAMPLSPVAVRAVQTLSKTEKYGKQTMRRRVRRFRCPGMREVNEY